MTLQTQIQFSPGYSNPLLDVSKHYMVDYSDVLLYADSMRKKEYDNSKHELAAYNAVQARFGHDGWTRQQFHDHVREVVLRRGEDLLN